MPEQPAQAAPIIARRTYPHGASGDAMRLADLITLVNAGADFQQIAAEIGYANEAGARRAVERMHQHTRRQQALQRRFGVELEIKNIDIDTAVQVLAAAGIDARAIGYTHHVVEHWKVLTDASVYRGVEVVSPPLRGVEGLRELRTVMKALHAAGATVDDQCGMHVHLDMNGLDADQIIGWVGFYAERQDQIDQLVSPSRRGRSNEYCQPLSSNEVDYAGSALRGRTDLMLNRYRKVNLMAYPRYGTVEIRHHQGTLNWRKAEAWIRMLLAIVEVGSQNTPAPASLAGMLAALLKHGGLDRRSRDYLLARAAKFGFADAAGCETDPDVPAPARTATAQPNSAPRTPCPCANCRPAAASTAN